METTTLAPVTASLVVPGRFAGPPGVANGGWLAGHLSRYLEADVVEVTLRAMTPVDRPVSLELRPDRVTVTDGEVLLATAEPAREVPVPAPFVNRAAAAEAEFRFDGFADHPFPGCFVCGPDRARGDGLRIFPGTVLGRSSLVASSWTAPGEGPVPVEQVWGALDCPTAWGHMAKGGAALLGRIAARIERPVLGGETYVVTGMAGSRDGRKLAGRGAIYTVAGELVAASRTTWIDVTGR